MAIEIYICKCFRRKFELDELLYITTFYIGDDNYQLYEKSYRYRRGVYGSIAEWGRVYFLVQSVYYLFGNTNMFACSSEMRLSLKRT